MKKKLICIFALILGVFLIIFLNIRKVGSDPTVMKDVVTEVENENQVSHGNNINNAEIEQDMMDRLKNRIDIDYTRDLDFWGKVIDQDGSPIEGARATIIVYEKTGQKKYEVFSDKKGLLELRGKKGARARVKVSREGYARTLDPSTADRMIDYTINSGEVTPYSSPTKEKPKIFILRKKNSIANLAYIKRKNVPIGQAGEIIELEFQLPGQPLILQILCRSSAPIPFKLGVYDWSSEYRVKGGAIQAINEEDEDSSKYEAFEAPVNGYEEKYELKMPVEGPNRWSRVSPNGQKYFWIKLNNGTYAKAHIDIRTGRRHEVDIELWYNLDGTNNFEE